MSIDVHMFPLISMAYSAVGTASTDNQSLIIMIQFPEYPLLATRVTPCPTLTKEFSVR